MGDGFVPTRRDVAWLGTKVAPIQPLLEQLEFTRGKRNWGYVFRFGVVKISDADRDAILEAMGAQQRAPRFSPWGEGGPQGRMRGSH